MKILSKRKLALNVFEALTFNEMLLSYFGSLNFELSNYLIQNLGKSLKNLKISREVSKKIYSSFVEGIENIIRHQSSANDKSSYGIVNVAKKGNGYVLILGNQINIEDKFLMEIVINEIKDFAVEELKEKFSSKLEKANPSKVDSAQLGVLQMAINCDNNIGFFFHELEDGQLFFLIEMYLEDE